MNAGIGTFSFIMSANIMDFYVNILYNRISKKMFVNSNGLETDSINIREFAV